jgi:hypothetical protein
MLVARHAILGRDAGADHLKRVELAGNLEQCACVLRRLVHLAHVARHDLHVRPALRASAGGYSGAQGFERCKLQIADAVALAVGLGAEGAAVYLKLRTGLVVVGFKEAGDA